MNNSTACAECAFGHHFELVAERHDEGSRGFEPTEREIEVAARAQRAISAVKWDQVPDNVFELPPEVKTAWERKNAVP